MLGPGRSALEETRAEIGRSCPELEPELLEPREVQRLEPGVGRRLWACRLETGFPVRPASATLAFAERARRAGALLHEGVPAWPWLMRSRARGVFAGHEHCAAGAVLVAAGPWTPAVIDPSHGLAPDRARVGRGRGGGARGAAAPRPGGGRSGGGGGRRAGAAVQPGHRGRCGVGRLDLPRPRSPTRTPGLVALRDAGARFVPALADAPVLRTRACARPAVVRRPSAGRSGARHCDGVWAAAGHGPWGISAGPATARVVADALLGRRPVPPALSAARGPLSESIGRAPGG